MTSQAQARGGWSKDLPLLPADIATFQKIKQKIGLGVIYVPFLVRKQVVAGTNYVFTAVAIYPMNKIRIVEIAAFIDLNGEVHDVRVTPLLMVSNLNAMPGSFTEPRVPTKAEKALFEKAVAPLKPLGVNYEPVLVSTQVTNGTNYTFLVRVEVANPQHTVVGYIPVSFHVDPNGTITPPVIPNLL